MVCAAGAGVEVAVGVDDDAGVGLAVAVAVAVDVGEGEGVGAIMVVSSNKTQSLSPVLLFPGGVKTCVPVLGSPVSIST